MKKLNPRVLFCLFASAFPSVLFGNTDSVQDVSTATGPSVYAYTDYWNYNWEVPGVTSVEFQGNTVEQVVAATTETLKSNLYGGAVGYNQGKWNAEFLYRTGTATADDNEPQFLYNFANSGTVDYQLTDLKYQDKFYELRVGYRLSDQFILSLSYDRKAFQEDSSFYRYSILLINPGSGQLGLVYDYGAVTKFVTNELIPTLTFLETYRLTQNENWNLFVSPRFTTGVGWLQQEPAPAIYRNLLASNPNAVIGSAPAIERTNNPSYQTDVSSQIFFSNNLNTYLVEFGYRWEGEFRGASDSFWGFYARIGYKRRF